ncbi:MAG: signal peptidase I, partial [Spirochaetota bacterium]
FFALSFALFNRFFLFQIFIVEGNSMLPSLKNHSIVLVSKVGYPQNLGSWQFQIGPSAELIRKDLIIFEGKKDEMLVKRIIAVSGDVYHFQKNRVFVNQKLETGDYLGREEQTSPPNGILSMEAEAPYYRLYRAGKIPHGYYLLLGDNRKNSTDSRTLGLVPKSKIRGKILFVLRK